MKFMISDPNENLDPVRVSKLLSQRGICSRREADALIERGLVIVDNERPVQLGEKVLPTQTLTLDPRAEHELGGQVTILLHKPMHYVSSQAEDGNTPAATIIGPNTRYADDRSGIQYAPKHKIGLAPAGRLDADSTGLLVFTQNGAIARQLIGDDTKIEKEYIVRIKGELTDKGLALLNHGLELDERKLRPAKVTREKQHQLRFILREGRKRQIRRMCQLVGIEVTALNRIRIGNIHLGKLPIGQWRYLAPDEHF